MADHKQIVKRCGERVVLARLRSDYEGGYMLGGNVLVIAGPDGKVKDGAKVEAMALHPAGLAVIPATGALKGKRFIIPGAHVHFAVLADDET